MWGDTLEAHGGYLIRLETFAGLDLVQLAREALLQDVGEQAAGASLSISVSRRRKVVRLSFQGVHPEGRRGAHWYGAHHALPRLLTRRGSLTVQAYVFDPNEGEEVIAYGNGRRVGGERLVYDEVELPGAMDELDEAAFSRLRSRWPLGHLAYIFNLTREELLGLPWETARVCLGLEGSSTVERLDALLPGGSVGRPAA